MATLKNTSINDTGYIKVPTGTEVQRPESPSTGYLRFNTDINEFEFYNGTEWLLVGYEGIITDGLILYLDAGNRKSYDGEGTTWTDLSGNGNNGTLVGTSTVSNGYVDLGSGQDTTNYITLPSATLNGLTSWTIEMWLYLHARNSIDTFLTAGPGNNFLWYFSSSGGTLLFENTGATSVTYNPPLTTPFLLTATGTNNTINVYNNGSYINNMSNTTTITTNSTLGIVLGQEMDSTSGGFQSSQKFRGKYGPVKFYNRVLSAAEIAQNFNVTRNRFGV